MLNVKKIGQEISKKRKKLDYTQENLAEMLHITAQAISRWENGHALPETTLLPYLSKIFNCTIDELLMPGFSQDENSRLKIEICEFLTRTKSIIINALDEDHTPISTAVTKLENDGLSKIYFYKSQNSEYSKWFSKNPKTTVYLFFDNPSKTTPTIGEKLYSLTLKGEMELVRDSLLKNAILKNHERYLSSSFSEEIDDELNSLWCFNIQSGKYYKSFEDGQIRIKF